MPISGLFILFAVIFAIVAVLATVGFQFLENQKRKKVTEMLKTATIGAAHVETKVLIDSGTDGQSRLARFLGRFNFARRMEEQIQQAGLTMSLNTLLIQMLVLTVPGALIGSRSTALVSQSATAGACAFVAAMLPYLYVLRTRKKRLAAFEEQFPEALEFLARAMRAGHAFTISLEMLSEESPQPLGGEFRKVFNEHNLGLPIESALDNLTRRVPLLDVRFFVSAVLLQRETGGNLAEILCNLAHVIRERFKLKGQVKAASAHGRITGSILTLMPVVLALGLMVVSPGYLQGMAKDSDGKYIIAGVIVGQIMGHLIIKRIVNIKV